MHTPKLLDAKRVIWAGAATSNTLNVKGGECFSIYLPAAFTGATLKVESLEFDGNWVEVYEDASGTGLISIGVTPAKRNVLPLSLYCGLEKIRLVSNASETCEGELRLYI